MPFCSARSVCPAVAGCVGGRGTGFTSTKNKSVAGVRGSDGERAPRRIFRRGAGERERERRVRVEEFRSGIYYYFRFCEEFSRPDSPLSCTVSGLSLLYSPVRFWCLDPPLSRDSSLEGRVLSVPTKDFFLLLFRLADLFFSLSKLVSSPSPDGCGCAALGSSESKTIISGGADSGGGVVRSMTSA